MLNMFTTVNLCELDKMFVKRILLVVLVGFVLAVDGLKPNLQA